MSQRCCECTRNGRCINRRCRCIQLRKKCVSCIPADGKFCENESDEVTTIDITEVDEGSEINNTDNQIYDDVTQSNITRNNNLPNLPECESASQAPFTWGNVGREEVITKISQIYDEIIHWKKHLFYLPSGFKASKDFIKEVTRLLKGFADRNSLEYISLKACFVCQILLLQKPFPKAKTKDLKKCMERRLAEWHSGNFDLLLREGRLIQKQNLKSKKKSSNDDRLAERFSECMSTGKVGRALRLLDTQSNLGPLDINERIDNVPVLEILKNKHPDPTEIDPNSLLDIPNNTYSDNLIIFERLDGPMINAIALKMRGAAGPSGVEAKGWRRFCSLFGEVSKTLCDVIAAVARRIATSFVDFSCIEALSACRLIPLNKNPGVRPIGIGEVLRRIICKSILTIINDEIKISAGSFQLCAGHEAGCEAAIHSMNEIISNDDPNGVLLIDASNAFNSLSRMTTLHNIQSQCPAIAPSLINFYRKDPNLFVDGETIKSKEGTTQGDPLAMAMFAIGISPLINKAANPDIKQIWYADDAAASGSLESLKNWWDFIVKEGPSYGYFPNGAKTWLFTKERFKTKATKLFSQSGIQITTTGRPYLGVPIGTSEYKRVFIQNKIKSWERQLKGLADIAKSQPHAAYAGYTHGLVGKITFMLRTNRDLNDLLRPLEDMIRTNFLPAVTGRQAPTDDERNIFGMATKHGGLAIPLPTAVNHQYKHSKKVTTPLVKMLNAQSQITSVEFSDIAEQQKRIKRDVKSLNMKRTEENIQIISSTLPNQLKRSVELASEKGASAWLSTLPLAEHGFQLHKSAFRDALCLRYGWVPDKLPQHCQCGKSFTVEHALSCPTGGFPIIRHNEVRDILATLLTEVSHGVEVEPSLQPLTGETMPTRGDSTDVLARADIAANGFFGGRYERAFFDVRICNPHARSYCSQSLASIFRRQEAEKRRKYERRVREVENSSFVPFVMACSGGLAPTALVVLKRLASMLSEKKGTPYSQMMSWIRCRLSFAMVRSSLMCLRGARSSLRRPAMPNCASASIALAEARFTE